MFASKESYASWIITLNNKPRAIRLWAWMMMYPVTERYALIIS